jgi:predicted metal-dependent HD superfamily phosphohydrolase
MSPLEIPVIRTKDYLASRWAETLNLVGSTGAPSSVLEEILTKYQEPWRYYHTLEHLRSGFEVLDRYLKSRTTGQVELAFWYHDFEYDPKATDNENKSAEVASERVTRSLQLPLTFAIEVGKLILATKHTSDPNTESAKVLLDMDLSILGEIPEVFDQYELGIRQEYPEFLVPKEIFRETRREILRRMLRDPFYNTPEMRLSPYESRVRSNIERSINKLS